MTIKEIEAKLIGKEIWGWHFETSEGRRIQIPSSYARNLNINEWYIIRASEDYCLSVSSMCNYIHEGYIICVLPINEGWRSNPNLLWVPGIPNCKKSGCNYKVSDVNEWNGCCSRNCMVYKQKEEDEIKRRENEAIWKREEKDRLLKKEREARENAEQQRDARPTREERDRLSQQLTDSNAKITRAQISLGVDDLDILTAELRGEDGDIWTLGKWKEELRIAKDAQEMIGRLYRQNPPSEDNRLTDILQEISENYLAISRESKQRKEEIDELKEILEKLEDFIIQDVDSFLSEKICNKCEKLEQLKANLRNELNENWYETLEDILEAQKAFIQSNNDLTLGQLRKFKQRLLNSGQVNRDELQEVCQVQAELIFLELKREKEQTLQAQIEISRN